MLPLRDNAVWAALITKKISSQAEQAKNWAKPRDIWPKLWLFAEVIRHYTKKALLYIERLAAEEANPEEDLWAEQKKSRKRY